MAHKKKIKWGIIGPGIIARQFANDIEFCRHATLVGVASREKERAVPFAKEFNIPKAYESYEALYKAPEIDAIYIATPHNFHYEQAVKALKAGKAVLCEKPLTVTPQETNQLIAIAQSTNQYLMEGMWTYFLPAIKKAKDWVNEGKIGQIMHVKADFGYPFPYDPKHRAFNPDLAGGATLDIGIYCIALAWLFLQQDPEKMNIICREAPTGVDADVSMLFEYENATASLTSSMLCKLNNWAYIIGEKAYIAIPDFWRAKECYLYEGEKMIEHFIDPQNGIGLNHETDTMSLDLLNGEKESKIMPHSYSSKLQEHMATVMKHF